MLLYAGDTISVGHGAEKSGGIYVDPARNIFILAHNVSANLANKPAIKQAIEILIARLGRETGSVDERVREAITLANNEIYSMNAGGEGGASCMMAAIFIEDETATIGLVGNTQVYQIGPSHVRKVTKESGDKKRLERAAVTEEKDAALIEPAPEAPQVIGLISHDPDDDNFIELIRTPFMPDNALLLCSKSMSRAITEDDMLHVIRRHPGNRARVIRDLASLAYISTDLDSISVLLIEGPKLAQSLRHCIRMER